LVLKKFQQAKSKQLKQLAVLIDPDEYTKGNLPAIVENIHIGKVDYIFVGGSLLTKNEIHSCITTLKQLTHLPVIIFPGSPLQIDEAADAIFYLSLISGRNADLLIGRHVETAPLLHKMDIEVMPTGYILVDGGQATTVSYISNSLPIPANKPEIAVATALAGQLLGLQIIYLDAGSGAQQKISPQIISKVSKNIQLPVIVGGGIKTPQQAVESCEAGADIIVAGNAFEQNSELIIDMAQAIHQLNNKTINLNI